jgi:glycosyltransferase involved in cell wall biosynthesis/peptidoglycan/xylan/chitin deacetylase (PgdA/CDA1 family)/protein-L-isoaspartate O-methyltransferase
VRYVREDRPGLDWARNRAIVSTDCDVIAFTDDDCEADPGFARAIGDLFAADPGLGCVTGLVLPARLDTEGQVLFEAYGGFNRGYLRRWHRHDPSSRHRIAKRFGGTGQFGTGANMAFRRSIFAHIGLFDPALDVGTATQGAGDLEMYFRVLKHGFGLVYEPAAVIRHHHRASVDDLYRQISTWGSGMCSYILQSLKKYPDERPGFLWLSFWMIQHWASRIAQSLVQQATLPTGLIATEVAHAFLGPSRYARARREAAAIAARFGDIELPDAGIPASAPATRPDVFAESGIVNVELRGSDPLPRFTSPFASVRVIVTLDGVPVAQRDVATSHHPVCALETADAISQDLGLRSALAWHVIAALDTPARPAIGEALPSIWPDALSPDVTVSICLSTRDRPDDLRRCLTRLTAESCERLVEIVVVDNNPSSGMTRRVTADFPGVRVVDEPRGGLSFARNAGFAASRGDIVAMTDDDVIVGERWLERLVAPFEDPAVQVVTGNVLPLEYASEGQRRFEEYGGLGRGSEARRFDGSFLRRSRRYAPATWEIGAGANHAVRASWIRNPAIGPLVESLGAGTPCGVGEDTYLFYRTLAHGGVIAYEPRAFVWHRHRATLPALRRQLHDYSAGHVGYHLTTLFRDGELRALLRIGLDLPAYHLWRAKQLLLGRSNWPWSLTWAEIVGHIGGPVRFAQAILRARRIGRTPPFSPISRTLTETESTPGGRAGPASESPAVSVVIPARNSAPTIARALESLQQQSISEWEAIVVDDGSTDATRSVVNRFRAHDRRIRVISSPRIGASAARNAGVMDATAPLLLFLDSDDWIAPDALDVAVRALAANPQAAAIAYGWQRLSPDGEVLETRSPTFGADAFAASARTCPVAIHAIVTRTATIRELGAFDESLVTCEDWDLWLRLTRSGRRIISSDRILAFYLTHAGTLSTRTTSLLSDGLEVLDRAHDRDARVASPRRRDAAGRPRDELPLRQLEWICWVVGQQIGRGEGWSDSAKRLPDGIGDGFDAQRVSEMLYYGLMLTRAAAERVPDVWHRHIEEIKRFLRAAGERIGVADLLHRVTRAAEVRVLVESDAAERSLSAVCSRLVDLAAKVEPLACPDAVAAVVHVAYAGHRVGTITLPVVAGIVPADYIRTSAARVLHWELLRAFLGETVYPGLTWRGSSALESRGIWYRGSVALGGEMRRDSDPHNAIGWTVLLQEIWGDPTASAESFYETASAPKSGNAEAHEGSGVVDISRPLSARRATGNVLRLIPVLGGATAEIVDVPVEERDGVASATAQRAAITVGLGVHLSELTAREALIGVPIHDGRTIRQRLRDRALCLATPQARALLARPAPDHSDVVSFEPLYHDRHHFESTFAHARDPWTYSSPYEVLKYEQTLALALEHGPQDALEIGCAEGHFTERLAPRVRSLVAADISAIALSRTAERLRTTSNVSYRQLDLAADAVEGSFDLIVCSEVLYYVGDREALLRVAGRLLGALKPGGRLVAAHAHVLVDDPDLPGFDWWMPFGARVIADTLASAPGSRHIRDLRTPYYRVSVFERTDSPAVSATHPVITRAAADPPEPAVAAHFRSGGGTPRAAPPPTRTHRLPILSYHRIADHGEAEAGRWRVSPALFGEQMDYLRHAGFRPVTLGEWARAMRRREPLPGRCVAITFDDGYADFETSAWPVLRHNDFIATNFLVAGRVGGSSEWSETTSGPVGLMASTAIRRLRDAGIRFGSHTMNHVRATTCTPAELRSEYVEAKATLEEVLGQPVRHLAFPHGDSDEASRELAALCGYELALGSDVAFAPLTGDPLAVPRLEVDGRGSLEDFIALIDDER